MFVSGPVGTSVIGSSDARIVSAMKSTACRGSGSVVGAGSDGPVHPALAVDVLRDERLAPERPRSAGGDGDVGAARELEQLQRVDRRLLERLVAVDGGDADELDLRAREREQERDRVVVAGVAVEQDLHARSISSTSAAVGREGCAPGREAASAPAAQARVSASSRGRPSRSETRRQAVNASPAAVPSTASTGGGAARAISCPPSRRTAPSAPSVSAVRPSWRPIASSS